MLLLNKRSLVVLGAGLAALLASCSSSSSTLNPVSAYTPQRGTDSGGDAVAPAPGVKGGKSYLFRIDRPPVAIQPASVKLANLVASIDGLRTAGLQSTEGAAAVIMIEDSPDTPWGTLLSEAQEKVFPSFADDESMGDWLILVTDVVVGGQDPVPATGYRWTRSQVNSYVSCGIPASGTNDCKSDFFGKAQSVVLAAQGYVPRGR
ncbi:MAG: hypothetical protein ACRDHO_13790 [Actinomycetota bacterium]